MGRRTRGAGTPAAPTTGRATRCPTGRAPAAAAPTSRCPTGRAAAVARAVVTALVLTLTAACATSPAPPATGIAGLPGPPAGAEMIARALLAPGADPQALVAQLRPAREDYAEVFRLEIAKDARTHYDGYWQHPQVVRPASGQTEFTVQSVTTEELLAGTGAADQFAGGFRTVAPSLNPGVRIYQIVFHAPGSTFGVRLDGLVHLGDRWRIFPAPWAVLTVNEPGHQH